MRQWRHQSWALWSNPACPVAFAALTLRSMTDSIDRLARRNVLVLIASQAILGAQLPMIFTLAGLAGQSLAPNACWATLPTSPMVIGSMLTATSL